MKTILVPVDFSDVTESVIETAKMFAKAMASRVFLLHVRLPDSIVDEPMITTAGSFVSTPPVVVPGEISKIVQQQLDQLKLRFFGMPLEVTTLQSEGHPEEMILKACQQVAAEMIIMGSHGHGAVYNLLVGSVTEGVLKSAKCPVLVVPSPRAG